MKKFDSFEEYIDVTKKAQIAKMKNFNCYLFPDEIKKLIQKGNLYYFSDDNTLEVIAKHGSYYKIYFYGTENFLFLNFDNDSLPIITDIAYSNTLKEKDLAFKEHLQMLGFKINSTSSRMRSDKINFDIKNTEFTIEKSQPKDVQDILSIWEENFDITENLVYNKDEALENIDSIYVLKNKVGLIVGAMQIVLNSNSGMIQHVAIRKDFQHKGLGSILEAFYINHCKILGIKTLLLYTLDSNVNAQNFHKKFGFDFDGKHNIQMIYRS